MFERGVKLNMFNGLLKGRGKYIAPIVVILYFGIFMSVMFYPMANMSISGLPFAVVSLDEGLETPAASVNVGETMAEQLASSNDESEDATIIWTQLEDQDALDEALDNNDYYGALVIPKDYTASQMAAEAGTGEASTITMYLDYAKSPMIVTNLQNSISSLFSEQGLDVEVEIIHSGSSTVSSSNPMSGMIGQQLGVMPIFMMTIMSSMMVAGMFPKKPEDTLQRRTRSTLLRMCVSIGVSFLVSLAAVGIVAWVGGIDANFGSLLLFLWLASFALSLVFTGLYSIAMPLGILGMFILMPFGMMTATLPVEVFPSFWQDFICTWVPQRFMGDGVRSILYMDAGPWTKGSMVMVIYAIVGLAINAISLAFPRRKKPEISEATEESQAQEKEK